MTVDIATVAPKKLFDAQGRRGYLQIQVVDPITVFYGSSASEITSSSTDPSQQRGFTLSSADGIQRMWVNGQFWICANIQGQINWSVDFM